MLTERGAPGEDPRCEDVVELVTDYLEGVLDPATVAAVDEHLAACPGCNEYLRQIQETVAILGRVRTENLSEETRSGLVAAFRDLVERPSP